MSLCIERVVLDGFDNRYFIPFCDYYEDSSLKYLFSVAVSGFAEECKVIDASKVSDIKRKYGGDFDGFKRGECSDADIERDLFSASACIEFNLNPFIFADMLRRSGRGKNAVEKTGYIMYNPKTRTVFFEEIHVKSTRFGADDIYKAGDWHKGCKILANVHTHPVEHIYIGKIAKDTNKPITDDYNYMNQFKKDSQGYPGDGLTAVTEKTARYTIGKFNVDFFSPYGKAAGTNNLVMTPELTYGKFNILKHALEVYGGKRR